MALPKPSAATHQPSAPCQQQRTRLEVTAQRRSSPSEALVEEVQRHIVCVVVHILDVVRKGHVHVTHDCGLGAVAGLQVSPGPLVQRWPVRCLQQVNAFPQPCVILSQPP